MSENDIRTSVTDSVDWPTFREIAREEFWIVAKSFFAPVYGTLLVLRQLLKVTQQVDAREDARLEAAE